jgi:SAM-dependent methyltransferase
MFGDAGWSSPVARQAHNLKVVGSNPTPATNANIFKVMGYTETALREATRLFAGLLPEAHQRSSATRLDRYPRLFKAASVAVPTARRVLSYGCSTGEECQTLARYFPEAEIIGADINPLNLLVARVKSRGKRIRYIAADDKLIQSHGPFDAVFCLGVLTRAKDTRNVDDASFIYPFERFAERVAFLSDLVRAGGVLAFHGTSYRFADTPQANGYTVITVDEPVNDWVVLFNPDGSKAGGIYTDCLFRMVLT